MKYHNKTHCFAYTNKDLRKIKETKEKAGNKQEQKKEKWNKQGEF